MYFFARKSRAILGLNYFKMLIRALHRVLHARAVLDAGEANRLTNITITIHTVIWNHDRWDVIDIP